MKNDNVKKLTATDLENLVYDLIKFCKAYDLWRDVKIYASGKSYTSYTNPEMRATYKHKKGFRKFSDIYVYYDDLPDKYILPNIGNEEPSIYVNPELLTMTYEGNLYELIWHDDSEVHIENLSPEAQADVLENDEDYIEAVKEIKDKNYRYTLPDGTPSIVDPDFYDEDEWEEYLSDDEFERYWVQEDIKKIRVSAPFLLRRFGEIFRKYGLRFFMGLPWSLTTDYIKRR